MTCIQNLSSAIFSLEQCFQGLYVILHGAVVCSFYIAIWDFPLGLCCILSQEGMARMSPAKNSLRPYIAP